VTTLHVLLSRTPPTSSLHRATTTYVTNVSLLLCFSLHVARALCFALRDAANVHFRCHEAGRVFARNFWVPQAPPASAQVDTLYLGGQSSKLGTPRFCVITGCKTRLTVTTMPTMLALVLASLCCLASTLVAAAAPAPAKPQLLSWNGKPTMCLTGPSTLGATVRTGCSQPALPDLAGGCMSPRSASSSLAATNVACLDSYGRTPCS
jgi:hypothetical protein